jgi:hypothetical protein
MDEKKYVLVKLTSGETLVGLLVTSSSKKNITLEQPLVYQVMSITNQLGMKVKDILVFKRLFDFTDEKQISLSLNTIISTVPANKQILDFYFKELEIAEKLNQQQDNADPNTDPEDESKQQGVAGNLNLSFNFEDPEHFQILMENIQMGLDGLLDEINSEMDMEEEDMDEFDDEEPEQTELPAPANKLPKRKKAKNRIPPKESFDLPYDENGDPKDPKSWSNNPNDYLK